MSAFCTDGSPTVGAYSPRNPARSTCARSTWSDRIRWILLQSDGASWAARSIARRPWLSFDVDVKSGSRRCGPATLLRKRVGTGPRASTQSSAERACGWSPDGRLLYLLLERDGFRDLYAQRIDPARGTPVGEPFIVQHLHDPRRRWGSTPFGTAIVRNAFVFNQVEMTGSIWLLNPNPTGRRPPTTP